MIDYAASGVIGKHDGVKQNWSFWNYNLEARANEFSKVECLTPTITREGG